MKAFNHDGGNRYSYINITKHYQNLAIQYSKSLKGKCIRDRNSTRSKAGFTLIEALAAMVIVAVLFSFAGPLFINQRIQNINSNIRTGAIAVSQQVLEPLAQIKASAMPTSGSVSISTSLASSVSANSNVLPVVSVNSFVVGQSLVIGSDQNSYIINNINSSSNKITLNSSLVTAEPAGAPVKLGSLGYGYDVTVNYCTNPTLLCNTNSSRNVLIQIKYNGKTVYTVETVYTQLS